MTIIGVAGLGTMGLGIVQTYAAAGFRVLATDHLEAARTSALDRLRAGLVPRVAAGKLAQGDMEALCARVEVVEGPAAMGAASLVIEAVVEQLSVKRALFSELEAVIDPAAVLATNTSSLRVAALAEGMRHPDRLLGLHFFNPAPVMRLVELVAHAGSSDAALSAARTLTETAGKTVIACPDRPGFIVNRCARPFYGEALALLEEGRTAPEIDAAMVAAGYRLGPFGLIDLIGADVNLAATEGLAQAMDGHPRYHVFDCLLQGVVAGRLGRKSGQGFVFPAAAAAPPPDADAIAARIEATLANEAAWLLAEGGVTPDGIDTAMMLGLNFPRGPFQIIASRPDLGADLAALEAAAPLHLRGRYRPAPLLA